MLWEFHFPEKEELKLRLKDMLEEQVDEKYYLADNQIERMKTTSYVSGGFEKRVRQGDGIRSTLAARDFEDPKCVQIGILDIKGQDNIKRVYSDNGLSPTLTDMQGGNRQPKIIASTQAHASIREDGITPTLTTAMGLGGGQVPMVEEPFIVASRGRNPENPSSREPGIHTEQRLEPNTRGITNTITSVQKDNYVVIGENQKKVDTFPSMVQKCGDRGKNTYSSSELSYTIPSNAMSDRGQVLVDRDIVTRKLRIRKLTPKECYRLMRLQR